MDLNENQMEKMLNFSQTCNCELDVAKQFLENCSWDVTTALDRFFNFGGDPKRLKPSSPKVEPTTETISHSTTQTSNTTNRPVNPMVESEIQRAQEMGLTVEELRRIQGTTGNRNRNYVSHSNNVPNTMSYFNEQLVPETYSAFNPYGRRNFGRNSRKDIGNEWKSKNGKQSKKQDQLADMFSDCDYKFEGSWIAAKEEAVRKNIWILVNINSKDDFASHCLNRDVWKDKSHSQIIRQGFLFFQNEKTAENGRQFVTYYNIHTYPHVSVVDPFTGRKEFEIEIPGADKFPKYAVIIHQKLLQWLDGAPNPKCKKSPNYKPLNSNNVDSNNNNRKMSSEMTDEERLNQALLSSISDPTTDNVMKVVTEEKQKEKSQSEDVTMLDLNSNTNNSISTNSNKPITLDPEPDPTDKTAYIIRIRTPDGRLSQRRYKPESMVEQLYRFIEMTFGRSDLSMCVTRPRMVLDNSKKKTLKAMQLNRATINCSFTDD